MLIRVDIDDVRSEVLEAGDLGSLSISLATEASPAAISSALGDLGSCDTTEHVWLNIDALKMATGQANDPEWAASFGAMIAYAKSKGWTDEQGTSVRAHIESE